MKTWQAVLGAAVLVVLFLGYDAYIAEPSVPIQPANASQNNTGEDAITVTATRVSDVGDIPNTPLEGYITTTPYHNASHFVSTATLTRTADDEVTYTLNADAAQLVKGAASIPILAPRQLLCYTQGPNTSRTTTRGSSTVTTGLLGCTLINTSQHRSVSYQAGMVSGWAARDPLPTMQASTRTCPTTDCNTTRPRRHLHSEAPRLLQAIEEHVTQRYPSTVAVTEDLTYTWSAENDQRPTTSITLADTLTVNANTTRTYNVTAPKRLEINAFIERADRIIDDAEKPGRTRSNEVEKVTINGLTDTLSTGTAMNTETMRLKHDLFAHITNITRGAVTCSDLQPRRRCTLEEAILTADTDPCRSLQYPNECIIEAGVRNNDPSVCNDVEPSYENLCEHRFEQR